MFVTVQFGENQQEIFNPDCRIIHFIHCLKERCNVDPEERVDLLDTAGELVSLSGRERSAEPASTLLKDRHSYVLVRVIPMEGTEGNRSESLLCDVGKSHPALAELLKRLANPHKERDKRGLGSRKSRQLRDTPTNHMTKSKSPRRVGGTQSKT
ncbi:uncharacterized protein C22orf15 [Brienomyrus brachyistius]|uniref:uncharacterized protein C22orf15 n=1 Tax=Brienomyrus brachyistius TaxID=42636 RepID=UPI0020B41E1D|nr:uncharacterized protein C22orf15 [Brienomyrus brachyistius]